jgi:hypothetical protein
MIKRGNQLARREIAARAEDDDGAGRRRLAFRADAAARRLVGMFGVSHAQTMTQRADKFNAVARESKKARPAADFFAAFTTRE